MSNGTINGAAAPAARRDENRLRQAVEALIFAAEEPLSAAQIARVFAEVTGQEVPSEGAVQVCVDALNAAYEERRGALRIEQWGGGYRMATAPSVSPFLKAFFQQHQQGLSRSLMETLAVIAYRQPVTKPEVDFVRGVDAGYAVRKLLDTGLIDVVGRSDSVGRPLLYGTTKLFLEQFGLQALGDLPNLREIEDLLDDPQFNKEKARMLLAEGLDPAAIKQNGAEAPDEEPDAGA